MFLFFYQPVGLCAIRWVLLRLGQRRQDNQFGVCITCSSALSRRPPPMSAPIPLSKSEKSYIQTALREPSPIRADGRSLLDYRTIALETGVASLANGSARVNIGKTAGEESGSGTEVIAAVKLEVEDVLEGEGVDGGRIACTVSWFVPRPHLFPSDLSLLKIAKSAHQQRILTYLLSRWMIYLTT